MSRSKQGETLNGMPILYDESVNGAEYYLVETTDPDVVGIKVAWKDKAGAAIDGPRINIPHGVLIRMVKQLDGEDPEALLTATSDQVTAFLRDNLDVMLACIEDPLRLPALIAAIVTVIEPEYDDEEEADCEEWCKKEEANDEEADAEAIRQEIDDGGYGEGICYEPGGCGRQYDNGYIENCDIMIDQGSPEFILIRYCIRTAYELLRKTQVRKAAKRRHRRKS